MNKELFKNLLKPAIEGTLPKDTTQFAELFATAYNLSNVGVSGTVFGSKLVSANKSFLADSINKAFAANMSDGSGFAGEITYKLFAIGICGYWASAVFTPLPALPPMSIPVKGTKVTYPGDVGSLTNDLRFAFIQGITDRFLGILTTAMIKHQTKIRGTYSGIVTGTPPTNLTSDWVGII